MAKKKGSFFLQLKRDIFTEKYANLSTNAKWLYVVLNELEHKFTGEKEDFFFRMNDDLAKDCNMALGTFKKAKKNFLKLIWSSIGICILMTQKQERSPKGKYLLTEYYNTNEKEQQVLKLHFLAKILSFLTKLLHFLTKKYIKGE